MIVVYGCQYISKLTSLKILYIGFMQIVLVLLDLES